MQGERAQAAVRRALRARVQHGKQLDDGKLRLLAERGERNQRGVLADDRAFWLHKGFN